MQNAVDLFKKTEDGKLAPKIDTGLLALFVGRSGSGKSAAEFSFDGESYFFDCDNRIRGACGAVAWMGEEKLKQISFDTVTYDMGFKFIDEQCEKFLIQSKQRSCKYQNFFFDSIGSLNNMLLMDSQALRLGKKEDSGKIRGNIKFWHPDDYNYVAKAYRDIIFKFAIPMTKLGKNVIFSGWIVDKWGKETGPGKEYSPGIIVGETLVGPNKLVEEIPGYFDEIYYFRRSESSMGGPKITVEFRGSYARTVHSVLPNGEQDITNKSFAAFLKEKLSATVKSTN